MPTSARARLVQLLKWSERYTKTDMLYLIESGFWLNLTSVVLSVFAFLLYIVFAHTLSKETFGTYQYLLSLSALLTSLTLTGMNAAIVPPLARGALGTLPRAVSQSLRFGLLAVAGSGLLALYYFARGNEEIAKGLILIGLFMPIANATSAFTSYLVAKRDFKRSFLLNICAYAPMYAALAFGAYLYLEPWLLIGLNLGSQAIMLALICRGVLREIPAGAETDEESLRFGKRASIANAFGIVAGQVDGLLAFHFLGATPLAVYAYATAIPDRLGSLLKFISTAALPKFALREISEIELWSKVWRTALVALLAAGFYALFAPLFFTVFFPQYGASVPYSQLYALTMLSYATNIWVAAFVSHRFIKEYAIVSAGTAVVQTLLQLAGILLWGLWGLILAKIASNLLSGIVAAGLFMLKKAQSASA